MGTVDVISASFESPFRATSFSESPLSATSVWSVTWSAEQMSYEELLRTPANVRLLVSPGTAGAAGSFPRWTKLVENPVEKSARR